MHKILPSDQIVSSIPDKQVFGIRGKYINDPHILKKVAIIDAFLHESFLHVRTKISEIKYIHPIKLVYNICIYIHNDHVSHIVSNLSNVELHK